MMLDFRSIFDFQNVDSFDFDHYRYGITFSICSCIIQQQTNFEELLNWFSFDWYDEPDEDMKTKKMEWRLKFLDRPRKRAKGRFTSRLRKEMKSKAGNGEKKEKNVLNPIDVPWDEIIPEIFNLTTFDMERAALKFSAYIQ